MEVRAVERMEVVAQAAEAWVGEGRAEVAQVGMAGSPAAACRTRLRSCNLTRTRGGSLGVRVASAQHPSAAAARRQHAAFLWARPSRSHMRQQRETAWSARERPQRRSQSKTPLLCMHCRARDCIRCRSVCGRRPARSELTVGLLLEETRRSPRGTVSMG